MDFDDDSDLTSLEDEKEERVDGAATHDFESLRSDSDSSHSLLDDEAGSKSQNGVDNPIPAVNLSPSRIGSSLARRAPVTGLRTYGRRRERSVAKSKRPPTPRSSPSSGPAGHESSLSPLPSPSPRKRRSSALIQPNLSSPSKRARKRNEAKIRLVPEPNKKYPSSRKRTTNGHDSSRDFPSSPTKRKENSTVSQSKDPSSSASADGRRRDSFASRAKTTKLKGSETTQWPLETLETLVWVRVDSKNSVKNDDSDESFWWPAMMDPDVGRRKAVQVCLLFPPSGSSTSLSVTVETPSPSNIISYKDHTYTANSFWSLPASSARSQPAKFEELRSRWEDACQKIAEEDLRLHDGFPSSLTALLSRPLGTTNSFEDDSVSRAASPALSTPALSGSPEGESWVPPPPDANISIPGEPVLSTTKTKGYWGKFYPAKVVAYVPPSKPTMPPRYTVHFMDNLHEEVTREMFYLYEQEEFGTCRLGEFESLESLDENDSEDILDENTSAETVDRIAFSDLPMLPAPPPEKFCELTITEQSSYIIPILTKVIENNYKAAEKRISAFLGGGRERANLSKEVPTKGLLTRSELNQLARIIRTWALGLESPIDRTQDVNGPHESEFPNYTEQTPLRWPEADAPQELASSPEKMVFQAPDKEPSSSIPPSSLPLPSTVDESPTSSPNGVADVDHDIITSASVDETRPVLDDHRPKNGVQTVATHQSTSSSPRSFKDLLTHEKIHFCTDVLLKEAVIQLLLWRTGKRCSPELLSETEELLLHESGSSLAGEFDIASTVKDLRRKKEKHLQAQSSSKQQISTGITRSRARKV